MVVFVTVYMCECMYMYMYILRKRGIISSALYTCKSFSFLLLSTGGSTAVPSLICTSQIRAKCLSCDDYEQNKKAALCSPEVLKKAPNFCSFIYVYIEGRSARVSFMAHTSCSYIYIYIPLPRFMFLLPCLFYKNSLVEG
jgi:hypothetical protein